MVVCVGAQMADNIVLGLVGWHGKHTTTNLEDGHTTVLNAAQSSIPLHEDGGSIDVHAGNSKYGNGGDIMVATGYLKVHHQVDLRSKHQMQVQVVSVVALICLLDHRQMVIVDLFIILVVMLRR